ncbi:MAG: hypothetical protein NT066_00020 [Candidatus Omnitrophica bacterium]|nr:hypothetical protein [Candidatus Omnitrophota bacterium]
MNIQIRNKRQRAGALRVFFMTVFTLGLFTTRLFAVTKLDGEMQDLEKAEKMEHRVAPEVIIRPKLEYKATDFRSPFWSPFHVKADLSAANKRAGEVKVVEPEKPLPLLKVQGVIWGGSFPQAIVNDKVVKIGDTIDGVRILSIDKENIVVFFEKKEYKIPSPAAGAITTTSNRKP